MKQGKTKCNYWYFSAFFLVYFVFLTLRLIIFVAFVHFLGYSKTVR
mgnify:CR=1 FL=1